MGQRTHLRLDWTENLRPQPGLSHRYGFSPVCE